MKRKFTKYPSKIVASTASNDAKLLAREALNCSTRDELSSVIGSLQSIDKNLYLHYMEMLRDDSLSVAYIAGQLSDELMSYYTDDVDACDKVMAAIHLGEFDLERRESNVENDLEVTARDDGDWIYFLSDDDAIHMPFSCYDMNSYYTKLIKNKNYNGFKPKKLSYKSFENSVNKLVDSSDSLDEFETKYRSFLCNLIGLQEVDACDKVTASEICYRDRDNGDRVVALDVGMSDEEVEEMLAAHPSYYRSTLDSVESSTEPKYFANMVSASTDDGDYKYYVAGYYDNLMRGLSDNLSTDSFDAVLEFANELANDGCFIQIKNLITGSEVYYDSNVWLEAIENGDVPEDVFEVTM